MVSQYVVTIAIAVVVLVFIVYRQMRTAPIEPRQLVILPVFLCLVGISNLQRHPPDSVAIGVALGISVLTALIFGVARGLTTQIWRSGSVAMRKGTATTLILWVVAILVRIVIGLVARRAGVPVSVTTGEIPVFLGITLAAQNVVIWIRGQEAVAASAS